jgi:hypothetical protein
MNARRPIPQRPTPTHYRRYYDHDWYWRYPYWDYPYTHYDDDDYYHDYSDQHDYYLGDHGTGMYRGISQGLHQLAYQTGFAHGVKFAKVPMPKTPPPGPTPPTTQNEGE